MDVIKFPEILFTTIVLSILLHGVISLPDATSYYDKFGVKEITCLVYPGIFFTFPQFV